MQADSKNINSERLRLARKKAGLSLRDLADRMEGLVSAQAIGKYERGEMAPSSDILVALRKALGVSMFYLKAPLAVELGKVEFRTKANTGAKDLARVETEVLEWVERYLQIEEILGLNSASWSSPFSGALKVLDGFESAENLANDLREKWEIGLGPIPNLTELLEEKGIKVLLADLPEKVSGLTCLVSRPEQGTPTPVVVINRHHSLERRRFSMAHELGHRLIDSQSSGDIEKLCHRFAGSFLVNSTHLRKEIGENRRASSLREVLDLKKLYKISAAAFLMRLEQVGVLDRSSIEYAFRTFASKWRSNEPEPLEEPRCKTPGEAPGRFERLVYRAVAEDIISISKAVELLRVPLAEVEKGLKGPADVYADHR